MPTSPVPQLLLALVVICLAAVLPEAAGARGHNHGSHAHNVDLGIVEGGDLSHAITPNTAIYWTTPEQTCHGDDCEAWTWTLDVRTVQPGQSLQVAVDEPYLWDDNHLEVTSSTGETVSASTPGSDYSEAVTVDPASRGTYQVRLRPQSLRESRMRLRAGLVGPTDETDGPTRDLLPNLRVMPPFDFTFTMPAQAFPGLGEGVDDTGSPVPGSCQADEQQVYLDPTQTKDPRLVTECLRFTTGPENGGEGHLDLRFRWPADPTSEEVFPMTQHIHRSDGTTTQRDAGTVEFHPTHAHHHHAETVIYDLVEVDGHDLALVSGGVKTGFCPLDVGFADWTNFDHATEGLLQSQQPGNCLSPWFSLDPAYYTDPSNLQGAMGLSAGWADIYDRGFSGQFVDFTGQDDGVYVVRVTVDHEDWILESDETDNVAYALIRVTGEDIDILERGYGTDHLDPDKVVVDDNRDIRHPLPLEEGIRRLPDQLQDWLS